MDPPLVHRRTQADRLRSGLQEAKVEVAVPFEMPRKARKEKQPKGWSLVSNAEFNALLSSAVVALPAPTVESLTTTVVETALLDSVWEKPSRKSMPPENRALAEERIPCGEAIERNTCLRRSRGKCGSTDAMKHTSAWRC